MCTFARMQSIQLSLNSILSALDLDAACLPLLEQALVRDDLMGAYTPSAVYTVIRTVGGVLNVPQKADRLAEDLEERINIIIHKLKFIAEESKPKVLFLRNVLPSETTHNAYLECITRIAGGVPVSESSTAATADAAIVISEKPIPRLLAELPTLLAAPEWAETAAVKNGNVFIVHHPDYLRHPGALLADDIEILAEILYQKQFFFGRDEDAWMKFEGQ